MDIKEIEFRKSREVSFVLSDSFQFLKQEYKTIIRLTSIYILPFLILYAVANVYFQRDIIWKLDIADNEKLIEQLKPHYLRFFIVALFEVFVQSMMIAVYYSFIEVYVKKGKGNFDFSEVSQLLFSNGSLIITASIAFFVIVCFGLILCVVPGIFFANLLSLSFICLIMEKNGVGNALTRSSNLVRSQWWNTFLVNIVGLIIVYAANWLITIIFNAFGLNIDIFGKENRMNEYPDWFLYVTGIKIVLASLFYLIPYTFLAFQYFSLDEQSKSAGQYPDKI